MGRRVGLCGIMCSPRGVLGWLLGITLTLVILSLSKGPIPMEVGLVINRFCPSLWHDMKVRNVFALKKQMEMNFSNQAIIKKSYNCSSLINPINDPSAIPEGVPLAFSIVFHRELSVLATQLDMLVNGARHAFCIHVDAKAKPIIRDSVHRMANCYRQRYPGITIIVPNDTIPVYWGHFSLLQRSVHLHGSTLSTLVLVCRWIEKFEFPIPHSSDLLCGRRLYDSDHDWQYMMSIAGTELPSVPLSILESKLLSLNGRSIIPSATPSGPHFHERFSHVWELDLKPTTYSRPNRISGGDDPKRQPKMTQSKIVKIPPPHNLVILKGMRNVILNRTMVAFIHFHPVAKNFLQWMSNSMIPEEGFYATLARVRIYQDEFVTQDLE
eukprot:TCALIF_04109-PA protein Name:"Similar to GCNT4 Beta-1,3-galactosyl-O-glycosyl-glycoprotein beta-1,6-N-acetylglucosaminyltransferase 4 (Homo sapiens)" AED:0.19 eAED:0.19 QI:483/1/0.5/1/1/1/2/0/381